MPENDTLKRGVRKQRKGVVVSKSGDKTVVVEVESREMHPFYGKVMRKRKKFHVHDEKNEAVVGNNVRIVECRPLSRLKRWRLSAVIQK
jgi:small subunit ribosomal protein S17